jgi:protein-serine/threonine kinase
MQRRKRALHQHSLIHHRPAPGGTGCFPPLSTSFLRMGGPDSTSELQSEVRVTSVPRPATDTEPATDTADYDRSDTTSQKQRNATTGAQNAALPAIDTLTASVPRVHIRTPSTATPRTPRDAGLHIQTDIAAPTPTTTTFKSNLARPGTQEEDDSKAQVSGQSQPISIQRGGSLRSTLSAASMHSQYSVSPSSRISSPAINALPDITPLPSPLAAGDSPTPWKTRSRPGSSGSLSRSLREEVLLDSTPKSSPPRMKQKSYGGLTGGAGQTNQAANASGHRSNRSISEFQPGALHNERPRNVTTGIPGAESDPMQVDSSLHREKYLAEQRGLVQPALPTPPPSSTSVTGSEADEAREESEFVEYLTVREGPSRVLLSLSDTRQIRFLLALHLINFQSRLCC